MGVEEEVADYRQAYLEVSNIVGVRLAENELGVSEDKAFGVGQVGNLLGINFDVVEWTYKIPPNKTKVILHQLKSLMENEMVTAKELRSVIGRITHYMEVIPGELR